MGKLEGAWTMAGEVGMVQWKQVALAWKGWWQRQRTQKRQGQWKGQELGGEHGQGGGQELWEGQGKHSVAEWDRQELRKGRMQPCGRQGWTEELG